MAKRYRPVQRDQVFLLPPSMREWLAEDHPVWLVIRAVEVHGYQRVRRAAQPGRGGRGGL